MRNSRLSYPFILLLFLSSVLLIYFYGPILSSPNQYLFGAENDGLKTYYSYAYHIKNDSSYIHFAGMNYPYGEHFLYTDCHPALANLIKALGTQWPFFINNSIGILNALMLFGILACSIVVFLLLRELGIKPWFALMFSFVITLLAPQLFRMEGHYALSYSVVIPLTWLLWLKTKKAFASWKHYIWLLVNNLFWLFIHAYLGVVALFFLTALIIVEWLWTKANSTHYLKSLAVVCLPIMLFFAFAKITDHHIDRTDNLGGFFLYNAEPDDIFIPHLGPVRHFLDALIGEGVIGQKWEARAYVGLPTTLIFAFLLIWFVAGLIRKKQAKLLVHFFSKKQIVVAFIASVLVLLFAFGIPFVQFPSLLDLLNILKQFRATGRFTWPFYFTSLVLVAYVMQESYDWSKQNIRQNVSRRVLKLAIIAVIGTIYLVEGLSHHQEVARNISRFPNTFNPVLLPEKFKVILEKFDAKEYQALLPLPFYHYGSESYWRPRKHQAMEASILLSYHSGLPIIGAALTRTSIPESKNSVQLLSPDFYEKPIQEDIISNRPILLIRTALPISIYEHNILAKAQLIHKENDIAIYQLYPADLFRNRSSKLFQTYQNSRNQLAPKSGFLTTDSSSYLYYNNFETQVSPKSFRGKGAFQSLKKGRNILDQFPPKTFEKDKNYQLSIWMHNGEKDALNHYFQLIIEEHLPGNQAPIKTEIFPEQAETIYGDWSLVEGTFRIQNPENSVLLTTKGNRLSKAKLYADDLLIREQGNEVYQMDSVTQVLFWNNHEVKLKQ